MNFDRGSKNLLAQRRRPFFVGQSLEYSSMASRIWLSVSSTVFPCDWHPFSSGLQA